MPLTVQSVSVSRAAVLRQAAAVERRELPLTVQLVSVAVPSFARPPPPPPVGPMKAELPLMVQLVSVAVP